MKKHKIITLKKSNNMKNKFKIAIGESYFFRQEATNGYGDKKILFSNIVITNIYVGIYDKTVAFKEKSCFFPQRYICSYKEFLEGIVGRI